MRYVLGPIDPLSCHPWPSPTDIHLLHLVCHFTLAPMPAVHFIDLARPITPARPTSGGRLTTHAVASHPFNSVSCNNVCEHEK